MRYPTMLGQQTDRAEYHKYHEGKCFRVHLEWSHFFALNPHKLHHYIIAFLPPLLTRLSVLQYQLPQSML